VRITNWVRKCSFAMHTMPGKFPGVRNGDRVIMQGALLQSDARSRRASLAVTIHALKIASFLGGEGFAAQHTKQA
jgi:hypothetical protein